MERGSWICVFLEQRNPPLITPGDQRRKQARPSIVGSIHPVPLIHHGWVTSIGACISGIITGPMARPSLSHRYRTNFDGSILIYNEWMILIEYMQTDEGPRGSSFINAIQMCTLFPAILHRGDLLSLCLSIFFCHFDALYLSNLPFRIISWLCLGTTTAQATMPSPGWNGIRVNLP